MDERSLMGDGLFMDGEGRNTICFRMTREAPEIITHFLATVDPA